MSDVTDPVLEQTFALYDDQNIQARNHVKIRWRSCPFEKVISFVPRRGRILDYGCGHGLLSNYLAVHAPAREVVGIDVAADKIASARSAAARIQGAGAPRFEQLRPGESLPPGPWDAVVIMDVLYLLEPSAQQALIRTMAHALAPGGRILIKEMNRAPRWKFVWGYLQEMIAVRVLRITQGRELYFVEPAEMSQWCAESGLSPREVALHEGFMHPHHLILGERAAA